MTKKIIEVEDECMIALKVIKRAEGQVHAYQISKLLKQHADSVKKQYPKQWKEVEDESSN